VPEIPPELGEADAFALEAVGRAREAEEEEDVRVEGVDCRVTDGEFAFKHEVSSVEPAILMSEVPPVWFCASLMTKTIEVPAAMLAGFHTYWVALFGAFNTTAVPPGTSP